MAELVKAPSAVKSCSTPVNHDYGLTVPVDAGSNITLGVVFNVL